MDQSREISRLTVLGGKTDPTLSRMGDSSADPFCGSVREYYFCTSGFMCAKIALANLVLSANLVTAVHEPTVAHVVITPDWPPGQITPRCSKQRSEIDCPRGSMEDNV